ncbi:hypothetical protein AB0E01_45050, partial [Nocardia vinacea]|uniref:hypothetical protein n=1 Tax=Nocardia vinacea TaxID=96468 RepID=UPI0033DD8DE2
MLVDQHEPDRRTPPIKRPRINQCHHASNAAATHVPPRAKAKPSGALILDLPPTPISPNPPTDSPDAATRFRRKRKTDETPTPQNNWETSCPDQLITPGSANKNENL